MRFYRGFRAATKRRGRQRLSSRHAPRRLLLESLEARLPLSAAPLVYASAGGDLTLRSIAGDYQIVDSQNPAQILAQQAADATSRIEIDATGASHLTIEFDANTPLPAGGIAFLAEVQNYNVLSLAGSVGSVVYNAADAHDGSIVVNDSLGRIIPITYAGLSPIYDNLDLSSRTFQFNDGGTPETITLSDAGAGQMTLASTNAESVTFANPTAALAIVEAGAAADKINVSGINAGFGGALSIIGGSGANTIAINSPVAIGSLAISATGAGSTALINADVSTTGTQTYHAPIAINAARTLTSNSAGAGSIAFSQSVALGTSTSGPATLTLHGSTAFLAGSGISYQLAPPGGGGSSLIEVAGDLQLSAQLTPQGFGGFAPGDYRLVDYSGSLTSTGLDLSSIPYGFAANISTATAGQVNLQVASTGSIAGDANGDSVVNGLDIALVSSNWLHQGRFGIGDANHDGVVNGLDVAAVASQWLATSSYAGTLNYHNDNMGTGQNLNETVLTPANVNSTSFGKVFSLPLDGYTFASPLYVPHVNIPGQGIHNVVYLATEHDSVYAYDADGQSTSPLWKVSFIDPAAGITTKPTYDTGETFDIPGEIGITGTPVIDQATGTMYVAAATKTQIGYTVSYAETLYALDITTGAQKMPPVVIQGSVPGNGAQSVNGVVTFQPLLANQRPALLLSNGVVYVGFGTHGNPAAYHGWLFGYSAATLQQVMVFCTTPDANKGGIWQAGGGPTADAQGNIYFVTGNGVFDAGSGGNDYGDTAVKLSPSGTVLDYFTPHDQATLDTYDIDMGAGGVLLLPDQPGANPHLMIVCGKAGSIYVLNRDDLGGYDPNHNDSQVVQYLPLIFPGYSYDIGNRITPVYYNGTVYFSADADNIKAFTLTDGLLSPAPTSQSSEVYQYPGGAMAISADGTQNGILWAVQRVGNSPGVLHAYDASNLANELYYSTQVPARDTMDAVAKFSAPLVANGRVYVGGATQMTVYGLLSEPDGS